MQGFAPLQAFHVQQLGHMGKFLESRQTADYAPGLTVRQLILALSTAEERVSCMPKRTLRAVSLSLSEVDGGSACCSPFSCAPWPRHHHISTCA